MNRLEPYVGASFVGEFLNATLESFTNAFELKSVPFQGDFLKGGQPIFQHVLQHKTASQPLAYLRTACQPNGQIRIWAVGANGRELLDELLVNEGGRPHSAAAFRQSFVTAIGPLIFQQAIAESPRRPPLVDDVPRAGTMCSPATRR